MYGVWTLNFKSANHGTAAKTIFAGKVAAVDSTDTVVVITANDYRDLLSISMPRHFFQ